MMTDRFVRETCLATLLLAFVLVVGCGPSGPVNDKVTKENIKKVQAGMKLADIEAILGTGEATDSPASYKPDLDGKLTFKKWQHSSGGLYVKVGFDATNEAGLVDYPK